MAVTMKNAIFWDVHSVALVRTDAVEEPIASNIRVTRISKLGLLATSNQSMLRRTTMKYSMAQYFFAVCFGC
jgi:hypothetical protein